VTLSYVLGGVLVAIMGVTVLVGLAGAIAWLFRRARRG
jgi:hypothetical protein